MNILPVEVLLQVSKLFQTNVDREYIHSNMIATAMNIMRTWW